MYLQSFGLREKPFALSPDPRYLFLAESHREALAHLLYGVDQGEGFIAVVGEVGTGKTTLCRTLLQRLGAETEVAFVFNPDLSPQELLEAVCREFGIVGPGGGSRRDLLDRIDDFLVQNKAAGRRVLLIIDEAQNLPDETLEQVRLLSNLETETSKLIQIVLLGQPELEAKLASKRLRQLGQRVSVWWNLEPMKRAEAFEYVRHRMRVAGNAGRSPFSDGALREVHRRALGVPRVMNVLCERSLLTAYAANAREVRAVHVRRAAAELGPSRSHGVARQARRFLLHPGWFAAAGAVAIAFGVWQALGGAAWLPGSEAPAPPAVSAPPPDAQPIAPADAESEPVDTVLEGAERGARG
jgi:general secretion pathway protein A